MKELSQAADLLWEKEQRECKAQKDLDRREWMKGFALVFACIALTLAGAAGLAALVRTP